MRISRFILLVIAFVATSTFAQKQVTVVIDPGHGGKDPGHLSHISGLAPEKDLNLKIANYLGEYIEKYLQNVKVVYTRTSDTYPSLDDRVQKANAINADYFISIHCNGDDRGIVRGTESHVHSMSSTKSVAFAREIEKQFSSRAGRHSRGVKDGADREHSIQVLKYTRMTSVLVECGFLTNTKEARYLNSQNGQEIIASAIFRAFRTQIQKEYPSTEFVRKTPATNDTPSNGSGQYTIQLMSSIDPIDTKSEHFKQMPSEVRRVKLNTTNAYKYKYYVGTYSNQEDAKKDLEKVQKRGYKDAFITTI